jgi:hypothetical protein
VAAVRSCALLSSLFAAIVASASAFALEPKDQPSEARYVIRVVRFEQAAAALLYRLDSATGEICAYGFTQRAAAEQRGCLPGSVEGPAGRFALEAIQGVRGSQQSTAYRVDRMTGEVCRFRVPVAKESGMESVDCVGAPSPAPPP